MQHFVGGHTDVASNAVHLGTALASDDAATIAAVLHHLELLQLKHGLADNSTAGRGKVSLACTHMGSAGTTIPLLESAHTSALAQVHFASHACSTNVEPVLIVWCELLESGCLHDVVVLRHIELGLPLEKISTSLDEIISWNILDGDTATGHPALPLVVVSPC